MLCDMTSDGAGESPAEPPRPAKAGTPAEFTAALRALRTWSGLTYRQLEGKAATYRDALPASTIATTLEEYCSGTEDQEFLVELVDPPA